MTYFRAGDLLFIKTGDSTERKWSIMYTSGRVSLEIIFMRVLKAGPNGPVSFTGIDLQK